MTDRNRVSLHQYDRTFYLWWEFIDYSDGSIGWKVFETEDGEKSIEESDDAWDYYNKHMCQHEAEQHCQWFLEMMAEKYAADYKRSRLADLLEEYTVRAATINEIDQEEGRLEFE